MSGFLDQTVTLVTYVNAQSDGGIDYRELSSEAAVAADLQPDTSGEAEDLRIRHGVITGKLYVALNTTINHETMQVKDSDMNLWEIQGPPVRAFGADTKWVTVRRQTRS